VRHHRPEPVAAWQHVFATPLYHLLIDPDGRPLRTRLRDEF
jgi:hypothetical protein